jgi:predicted homoserine dehydrogenase-like protein
MQGEPLRVGLVGGGFIGGVVGAQFAANPDATVAAIADPSVSPMRRSRRSPIPT